MVTIDQIKELREKTGISIGQCKKALEEAGGDIEKATIILSKKGGDFAAKKSDRMLKSGTIATYVHSNGKVGSMVELLCETDFVAKNEEFTKLAYDIAMQIAATNPTFVKKEDITEDDRQKAIAVFEEEVKDKPTEMREKILEGKLNSYFKDKVLTEQDFIKNPESTISKLVEGAVHKFGERMEIGKFVRFQV
ncbi:MAG: elongation factor Ts [Candidatus Pacebacteria bacterium]|nr:elongation factor Ts [Candidatus Paceibacterota bacterium]